MKDETERSEADETENSEAPEHEAAERDELQARIDELETELAGAEDRYLRAAAELRNYRRRVIEEQTQRLQYAHEQLITALLPVLDHMELALQSARDETQSPEETLAGVDMIHRQLIEVLEQFGLTRLAAAGEQFDPRVHEAVEQRSVEAEAISEGEIIEEFRPGYRIHDRLVRPAEVCVCIAQEGPDED